jgi:hypothetical protein
VWPADIDTIEIQSCIDDEDELKRRRYKYSVVIRKGVLVDLPVRRSVLMAH